MNIQFYGGCLVSSELLESINWKINIPEEKVDWNNNLFILVDNLFYKLESDLLREIEGKIE